LYLDSHRKKRRRRRRKKQRERRGRRRRTSPVAFRSERTRTRTRSRRVRCRRKSVRATVLLLLKRLSFVLSIGVFTHTSRGACARGHRAWPEGEGTRSDQIPARG
jgi:hypothetical protein